MTIAEFCILAMVLLWLAPIGLAKGLGWGQYDNARPRDAGFYSCGWRSRALAAHQNGMEALPLFIAAVLVSEFRHAPQAVSDGLAVAFIVGRTLYVIAYLADRPFLRSTLWTVSFLISAGLFVSPLI